MAHYHTLNDIYLKYLCRPIDLDGYNTYSAILDTGELTLTEINDIIKTCSEAELYDSRVEKKARTMTRINKTLDEFVPPEPGIAREHFHVVVSRYNEDPSWLKKLVYYDCVVFLYNKGGPISTSLPPNVSVLNIENIGYEDYAYVAHVMRYYEYYKYNNTKVVFAQCGIDHCPDILDFLKNVPDYGKYSSFCQSMGMSEAWGGETGATPACEMMPVVRNMTDIGGGKEYVDAYVEHMRISTRGDQDEPDVDLYKYYCDYFQVPQLRRPVFSPCAIFIVPSCKITKQNESTYSHIKSHIEHVHKDSNPIMSKIFASIMERLWYTLFI